MFVLVESLLDSLRHIAARRESSGVDDENDLPCVGTIATGCLLVLSALLGGCSPDKEHEAKAQLRKEQAARAAEMFEELCKKSGETITRTVDDVDAILLLRIRPEYQSNYSQFGSDDPYGSDLGGDAYIRSFLKGFGKRHNQDQGEGYSYIEAITTSDGLRYRYAVEWKAAGVNGECNESGIDAIGRPCEAVRYEHQLTKIASTALPPRYAVTYEDISTPEQKELWIAGSSLRIIDTHTNEVIAERIGFMRDSGLGNTSGGRSPWAYAAELACPPFGARPAFLGQTLQTARFAKKVVRPIR